MPKERELIEICKQEKDAGRKTLVYSVYTGTRDTTSRLKGLLEQEGFKVAVLRASVDASRREDWIDAFGQQGARVVSAHTRFLQRDFWVRPQRHPLLLSGPAIAKVPRFATRWGHRQAESVRIGDGISLARGFRLSDGQIGKRHV